MITVRENGIYTGADDNFLGAYAKRLNDDHRNCTPIDHPDGSVTDEKIGKRTITTVNGTVTDSLTALLNRAENDIRQVAEDLAPIDEIDPTSDKSVSSKVIFEALSAKEDASDRVCELSESSTDQAYPSAKCVYDALSEKEDVENRVTEISKQSTDSQYPSAKSVYSLVEQHTEKRYGARRQRGSRESALSRIWDATLLTAQSFDGIYPWSAIRRCNIDVYNGRVRVLAYEGDSAYREDGSCGNVAVEVPDFYSCPPDIDDDFETFGVSASPIPGWIHHKKAYYGAFLCGESNGMAVSQASVMPKTGLTRDEFRKLARKTDSLCSITDSSFSTTLGILFAVEHATLNCQSILRGAVDLVHTKVITGGTGEFYTASGDLTRLAVGQSIAIGTAYDGAQLASCVKITALTAADGKCRVQISENIDVPDGAYISPRPWECGMGGIFGTDGRYPTVYRKIENPWGNLNTFTDGINIKNRVAYCTSDKDCCEDGVYNQAYLPLCYTNAETEGYIRRLGFDERYPFVRLPVDSDGAATFGYGDYYYPGTGETVLYGGGAYDSGSAAGIWYSCAGAGKSFRSKNTGARLMWQEETDLSYEKITKSIYTKDGSNALFANMLNGTKQGTEIEICDASPLSAPMQISLLATGSAHVGGATVKLTGKNRMPMGDISVNKAGMSFKSKDGALLIDGTSSQEVLSSDELWKNSFALTLAAGTYCFTAIGESGTAINSVQLKKAATDDTVASINGGGTSSVSFTLSEKTNLYMGLYIYQKQFDNATFKFQIEKSSSYGGFEPYTEQSFTADAEGKISDAWSLSPNMVLTAASDGVQISCTYARDLNKAFYELAASL